MTIDQGVLTYTDNGYVSFTGDADGCGPGDGLFFVAAFRVNADYIGCYAITVGFTADDPDDFPIGAYPALNDDDSTYFRGDSCGVTLYDVPGNYPDRLPVSESDRILEPCRSGGAPCEWEWRRDWRTCRGVECWPPFPTF